MGDLQVLLQKPNGGIIDEARSSSSSASNPPHPLSVGFDYWLKAEQTIQDIISQIRPTSASEQRREEVTHYIQRLIGGGGGGAFLGTKVFPYGSVPLKTYLPDGDIDLTAISSLNVEDALAKHVHAALEREEQNKTAEFEVKDIQYINAEVKLVKCLVQNIVVDISFNQSGGLSTLCFLEHVDRLIGKNHLFKRSVILIKAWCYYESRILGAHHGLISTYALETLVLYIFHLFFTSLNGPLAVLYRFLDYFSKFDWDKYCVSLNGPIYISSLPEVAAETLENDGGDLLLGKEFLRDCVDLFSIQLGEQETNSRAFLKKYLNIVDPLKENNNLGRSVSRGNFYRIRSAFAYGARKLGQILLRPPESIAGELHRFFLNTLDRHGNRQRPDVEDPIPPSVIYESSPASSKSRFEKHTEDEAVTGPLSAVYSRSTEGFYMESWEPFEQIHETRMPMTERKHDTGNANGPQRHGNGPQRHAAEVGSSSKWMVTANGITISGLHLPGDAKESSMRKSDVRESPATSRIQVPKIGNETPRYTPLSSGVSTLPPGHHAPDLYFSHSLLDNGKVGNGRADLKMPTTSIRLEELFPNGLLPPESHLVLRQDGKENEFVTNNTVHSHRNHKILTTGGSRDSLLRMCSTACGSKNLPLGYREVKVNPGNPEAMSSLSDLSGDYESYLEYLNYVKWCNDAAYRESLLLTNPSSLSQFRNKHLLDIMGRKLRLKLNATTQMNANGVIRPSSPYPLKVPTVSGASSCVEEVPKPRGMGTYFPSMNLHSYRDTPSAVRERNLSPVNHGSLQRPPHSNGGATIMHEAKVTENSNQELLEAENKLIAVTHGPMQRPPHNNGWSTVMQEEKLIEKSSQELLEAERNPIPVNNASLQRPPHSNGWATKGQEQKEIEKSSKEPLAVERKQIAVNRGSIQVKKPIENSIQGLVESEKNPSAANHGPMQRPPHNNGWATTAQEEKLIKKSSEELVEAERNQLTESHSSMQRPPHSNGWATAIQEEKPIDQFIQELLEAEFPLLPSRAPPRPVEFSPAGRLSVSGIPNANGCLSYPSEKHECGSSQLLPVVAPLPEVKGMQPEVPLPVSPQPEVPLPVSPQPKVPLPVSPQPDGHSWEGSSSLSPPSLAMPSPTPVMVVADERVPVQLYHLKDDSDFPPLSCLNACGRTCRRR